MIGATVYFLYVGQFGPGRRPSCHGHPSLQLHLSLYYLHVTPGISCAVVQLYSRCAGWEQTRTLRMWQLWFSFWWHSEVSSWILAMDEYETNTSCSTKQFRACLRKEFSVFVPTLWQHCKTSAVVYKTTGVQGKKWFTKKAGLSSWVHHNLDHFEWEINAQLILYCFTLTLYLWRFFELERRLRRSTKGPRANLVVIWTRLYSPGFLGESLLFPCACF